MLALFGFLGIAGAGFLLDAFLARNETSEDSEDDAHAPDDREPRGTVGDLLQTVGRDVAAPPPDAVGTDENDKLAVDTLQKIYDEVWGEGVYKCVGVQSDQVVYGGGNIHCITQQEPSA